MFKLETKILTQPAVSKDGRFEVWYLCCHSFEEIKSGHITVSCYCVCCIMWQNR